MAAKYCFAELALKQYGVVVKKKDLAPLVEEAKKKVRSRGTRSLGSRLKFVLVAEEFAIQPSQHKLFFVQSLLEQLGVEVDEVKVRKTVDAAASKLLTKLKLHRKGLRPRLLVVS